MKKVLKKTAVYFMALAMLLTLFVFPVSAQESVDAENSIVQLDSESNNNEDIPGFDINPLESDEESLTGVTEYPENVIESNASESEELSKLQGTDGSEETLSTAPENEAANEGPLKLQEDDASDEELLEDPEEDAETDLDEELELNAAGVNKGTEVKGTFDAVADMDIATVRFYKDKDKKDYGFADLTYNEKTGKYDYSFKAPYDGFEAVQASSIKTDSNATIIAQYYSLTVWDGAVDVSWYDEESPDFYLYNPAELAGFAAIVNGSVDGGIEDYQVKGFRSSPDDRSVNRGLPDYIESDLFEDADLIAGVKGQAYKGVMEHDFADRTVHIMADMDMGGEDGSAIVHSRNTYVNPKTKEGTNAYDYPNWAPIGGEYLMDVSDPDSMIISFFNGTIEGHGHAIDNLYCYRWSWPSVGETAYGYAQGTGFVGDMGTLYDDNRGTEENPSVMPAIRNLSLSGYIFGRRMVGGFVGCVGGGANAADGSSVPGGICLENLANHAYCYGTDSKGIGGIVGCSMAEGSVINCYNTGNLDTTYGYPTGGIIASNEGMDVFCCYNTGTITSSTKAGRGIGSDNGGRNYNVDNCYYLEGCGDDLTYPGYYDYNLSPSVSINVTAMTASEMTNGKLLAELNVNGTAYVAGDNGYPVLYWEKESGQGSLSVEQPQGGTVTPVMEGEIANGTVVYLENEAETGWVFRYYTMNGKQLTGDYVTIDGDCVVSAYFEAVKPGVLEIAPNDVCDITVTKDGVLIDDEGNATEVKNYPVVSGDSLYERDLLAVTATIKEGAVPEDESLQYSGTADLAVPYDYEYTYTGGEPRTKAVNTFVVGSEINEIDTVLTLKVLPRTTQKLWRYIGDTSWYDESKDEFILSTANELAGFQKLVNEGTGFAGKTVKLANDISLKNNDGTNGTRFWDGIGTNGNPFSGTFDGHGHKITDYQGNMYGFFACVFGTEENRAAVKDLEIYGESAGLEASGIISRAKYADISGCISYCRVKDGTGWSGGILGYAQASSTVKNCINYGKIDAKSKVGGIAGEISADSTVEDCINNGDINVADNGGNSVGGVIGSLNGQISRCANYGNLTAYGRSLGGVAGQSVSKKAVIADCYNVGKISFPVSENQYDSAGGIVGFGSFYNISNSFNYGVIDSSAKSTGGIIGREAKQSTSSTADVYYLDSSCSYAEDGIAYENLPSYTYTEGMKKASTEEFADTSAVLSAINDNFVFTLSNGKYPEFASTSDIHVHTGGSATCSTYAVCDICGLEYGDYDPDMHTAFETVNNKYAVWAYDGYTGDKACKNCGTIIEKGSAIPADTERQALEVVYKYDGETLNIVRYTVGELDKLKTTGKIGYTYGFNSNGSLTTSIMAATEYVLIKDLIGDAGFKYDDIDSIVVEYAGNRDKVTKDTLTTCTKYYEDGANPSSAPAAICITYASLDGTLDVVAQDATPTDVLRFGYGMSEDQYKNKQSLGGRRLVSPVEKVEVNLAAADVKTDVKELKITKAPDHTSYHIGDTFHDDGMVLTAIHEDGTEEAVTDYVIDITRELYPEDDVITVFYDWKSVSIPVTVSDHSYNGETHRCDVKRFDGTVCGQREVIDTSALEAALKKAGESKDGVGISSDGKDVPDTAKWVSQSAMDALDKAIADAEALLKDEDISQKDIDSMTTALNAAVKAFDNEKKNGLKKAVTAITLDKETLNLTEGDSAVINAVVEPEDATDKTIIWSSSDNSIAVVDSSGKVGAVKAGSADITASSADGTVTAVCKVTVEQLHVTSIEMEPKTLTAEIDDSLSFKATVLPAKASNKEVTWSSSDPSVVRIENDGRGKALKAGTAVITVVSKDNEKASASCTVTVNTKVIGVKSVTLEKTSLQMPTSSSSKMSVEKLVPTVLPTNATNKGLTWASSNPDVVRVDASGNITALKYGTAVITVTSKDNKSASAKCTVQTRFNDVNGNNVKNTAGYQYYYDPVYWAANNGITKGYDQTLQDGTKVSDSVYFGPARNCTRREMIIFMWRASGKPSASGSLPFSDTKKYGKSTDSYKAILWGYTKGIIKGYTSGKFKGQFRPDDPVVRKDCLIMLYRLAKKPAVSGTVKFPDVVKLKLKTNSDTYKAILWGVKKGITNGYADGNFQPMTNCLREHIVTFLWRYKGKPTP